MRSIVVLVMVGAISLCLGCAATEETEDATENVGTATAAVWIPFPSPHGVIAPDPDESVEGLVDAAVKDVEALPVEGVAKQAVSR
jgi:hypothetical protein